VYINESTTDLIIVPTLINSIVLLLKKKLFVVIVYVSLRELLAADAGAQIHSIPIYSVHVNLGRLKIVQFFLVSYTFSIVNSIAYLFKLL